MKKKYSKYISLSIALVTIAAIATIVQTQEQKGSVVRYKNSKKRETQINVEPNTTSSIPTEIRSGEAFARTCSSDEKCVTAILARETPQSRIINSVDEYNSYIPLLNIVLTPSRQELGIYFLRKLQVAFEGDGARFASGKTVKLNKTGNENIASMQEAIKRTTVDFYLTGNRLETIQECMWETGCIKFANELTVALRVQPQDLYGITELKKIKARVTEVEAEFSPLLKDGSISTGTQPVTFLIGEPAPVGNTVIFDHP